MPRRAPIEACFDGEKEEGGCGWREPQAFDIFEPCAAYFDEVAGMAGLEPANARVKVWCLTTWRHPNIVPAGRQEAIHLLLRLPRPVASGKAAFVWGE